MDLDVVLAGKRRLEPLDLDSGIVGDERKLEAAEEIAAKPRLLERCNERDLAVFRGLVQQGVGEHIEHRGGRKPLLGARYAEQRVEIDEAAGKLGRGLRGSGQVERELALEQLRAPLRMDGELEFGKLDAVGRGAERAF